MCGIAGFHRRGDALVPKSGRLADMLLHAIQDRGRDATGLLAVLPNGKVQLGRETIPAPKFVETRKRFDEEARSVLLHVRFATVGRRDDVRNAHPVLSGRCAAIHNGTIYNHRELTEVFGLTRRAEVDSEVIPAMVEFAGWENAKDALDLLDGGAAVAIVNVDRPTELILARTESYPLVYFVTDEMVVWASTRQAIERAWLMTYGHKPKDGKFVVLDEWTMVRVNGELETIRIRKPKPKPKFTGRSRNFTYVPRSVIDMTPTKGKGKRRKTKQTKQLALPPYDAPEPYMEEAVRQLEREGWSYADAFDAVFGVSLDDDEVAFLRDDSSWSGPSWQ